MVRYLLIAQCCVGLMNAYRGACKLTREEPLGCERRSFWSHSAQILISGQRIVDIDLIQQNKVLHQHLFSWLFDKSINCSVKPHFDMATMIKTP